ncbi:MAG: HAD hydrolase-like protein [Solirubrobacteraceae bacterium]
MIIETLVQQRVPPRSADVLDRCIGPPLLVAFAELTGEAEGSDIVAACAATYHQRYERMYLQRTSLVDGIRAVLGRLTLPLALATAKPSEFVAPLLDAFAIAGHFRFVMAPSMSALKERKTVTVGRALRALGATKAVIIGDRSFDIEAARANRARAAGVTWGIGDRAELQAAGADAIVERPAELLELLRY